MSKEDWYKAKCAQGDKSDNITGIKGWGKVTIARYIAGVIEPTEEQKKIIENNHEMFRLDRYVGDEEEIKFLKDQLSEDIEVDYEKFVKLVESCGIHRIDSDWHMIFVSNRKLSNLFV